MRSLTQVDIDALLVRMNDAGAAWQQVATDMPETLAVLPGDATWRDRVTLDLPLRFGGQDYDVTLYFADEAQQWYSTGWSDASRSPARLMRPSEVWLDRESGMLRDGQAEA